MTYAILLASGLGQRFKKTPTKALYPINGQPLFMYSLNTFLKVKAISKIVLVVPPNLASHFQKHKFNSKVLVCLGNTKARYLSLSNGIDFLNNQVKLQANDIILTHDAARPNVTTEIIEQNIKTCVKFNFASTLLPLTDSLCKISSITQYINRDDKYLVQTPQALKYKEWKNRPSIPVKLITDLFTYLNVKLNKNQIVKGSLLNFKITTEKDLFIFGKLVKNWSQQ